MLIAYILLLAIGIFFKYAHWPFASIILIVGVLLPTVDVLVQLIRKVEIKGGRALLSLGIAGFSVFVVFKLLNWPGATFIFLFAIALNIPFIIWCFVQGVKRMTGQRLVIWGLVVAFSIWLFSLSRLDTILTFMPENPENPGEMMPIWIRHEVAYLYNQEKNYKKAEIVLNACIESQTKELSSSMEVERRNAENCLKLLIQDKQRLMNRDWTSYESLFFVLEQP